MLFSKLKTYLKLVFGCLFALNLGYAGEEIKSKFKKGDKYVSIPGPIATEDTRPC